MSAAGAGVAKSADFPGPVLDFDAAIPAPLSTTTAHNVFIEWVPVLLNRLNLSEDAALSYKKRVQVRGAIYSPTTPNVRFAAEYRGGKLDRVRIMTVSPSDEDRAALPEEFGGTGLMAAATSDDDADAKERPSKRARKEKAPETLAAVLAKAHELARLEKNDVLASAIDALLKSF